MTKAKTLETRKDETLEEARKVSRELGSAGHEIFLAGLGVVATVEQESRKVFKTLVERGDAREKKLGGVFAKPLAKPLENARERVKELGHELDERFQGTMNATLKRFGVPSSQDVQDLIARVEKLTTQVESLAAQR